MPISKTMFAVATILSVKSRNCSLYDKLSFLTTDILKAIYLHKQETIHNEPAPPYDTSLQGRLFGNLRCGEPVHDVTRAIIGGQDAPEMAWPWQVAILRYLPQGEYGLCGGSLISESWVLTAAHCVESNNLRINLGVSNIDDTSEPQRKDVGALKVIKHPDYQAMSVTADIALIQLDEKVVFNDYIRPICLPKESEMMENDDFCFITGWGMTNTSKPTDATVLQQAQVNIMPRSLCSYTWAIRGQRMQSRILCLDFQDDFKQACFGDSGGPLACKIGGRFVLYGVTSTGYKDCMSRVVPSLYTSVSAFIDWIVTTIAENDL